MANQSPNILQRIVEVKRREIASLPPSSASVSKTAEPRRDFMAALRHPRQGKVALIAEIKKASPSAGIIRPDFDPVAIAKTYEAAGASCLSVLTDEQFFQGHLDYLQAIRAAVKLPLLRKDFIIDERQIAQSFAAGADAILLIVAILSDEQLRRFQELAWDAGLTVLVEVHDEAELDRAVLAGGKLLGVNNRDLRDFRVDLATTERLAARLWQTVRSSDNSTRPLLVAESGIYTSSDVRRLADCGASAILVGESLMRRADIGAAVRELMSAPTAPAIS